MIITGYYKNGDKVKFITEGNDRNISSNFLSKDITLTDQQYIDFKNNLLEIFITNDIVEFKDSLSKITKDKENEMKILKEKALDSKATIKDIQNLIQQLI